VGGLEGLGADPVDDIADGELGRPEGRAVVLGGAQFGQLGQIGVGGGPEGLVEAVGRGARLGRQFGSGPGKAPAGGISGRRSSSRRSDEKSTNF
jgi:hypothetical protein